MRRFFVLLFVAAAFAAVAHAQCGERSSLGYILAGPCTERYARQAYAPVYINNGYGYGYYGGRLGTNLAVSAVAGLAGGLVADAISHRSQTVYAAPSGGQYYSAPNSSRPLDCRKRQNKVACEAIAREQEAEAATRQRAAEQESATQRQTAERQTCLDQLAASSWRLRNFSAVATIYPTVDNRPLVICGEQVALRPLQTVHIFPPDGQVGGYFFFAHYSGEKMRAETEIQAVNRPGFTGYVLTIPGSPKEGN